MSKPRSRDRAPLAAPKAPAGARSETLRRELVSHFRDTRDGLRRQWIELMTAKELLRGLTPQETETESMTIYDTCVDCIATGRFDSAQKYATAMAERGVLRGMTTEQIIGGMLTLRDVYGRRLAEKYRADVDRLWAALDIFEPVANRILSIVALAFIEERERVVRAQQEAIRELSTPVLTVRDRLLILPIIGLLDTQRARQLTAQLLRAIRSHRGKVVVMDLTGVPAVDSKVANHLVQTVEAARLMGADVIVTGLSAEVSQTLVTLGVDLSKLNTVGDLQGGIDQADRMLGYRVVLEQSRT